MAQLILKMALTLDGLVAGPDGDPLVLGKGLGIFDGSDTRRTFKLVTDVRFGHGLAGKVLVPTGKT